MPLLPAKQRSCRTRTGSSTRLRRVPRRRGTADHADRADRGADDARRGPDLTSDEVGREAGGLDRLPVRQGDPTSTEQLARLAERGGFDVVSVYKDLFFQPAIYPLLLMARVTERVRLGPAALNPFTLHPVEIAGQIAALDAASGGRAYLGLVQGSVARGAGDRARPPAERQLREAVEVIRGSSPATTSGFDGERFSLAPGARLRYEPLRRRCRCRSAHGAFSARPRRRGGGDELKVGGTANPDLVPTMRDGSETTASRSSSEPSPSWTRTVQPPAVAPAPRPRCTSPSSPGSTRRSRSSRPRRARAAARRAGDAAPPGSSSPTRCSTGSRSAGTPERVAATGAGALRGGGRPRRVRDAPRAHAPARRGAARVARPSCAALTVVVV